MYVVEELKSQNRRQFNCGEEALNVYLRERASQDIRRRLNRIYIIRKADDDVILGYYTLAAATIESFRLPPEHARHLPRYPIPAALLGKLAVDQAWQEKGIGRLLLANAIRRVQVAEKEIGIHALIVDPLTEKAAKFYASIGFAQFPPERRMFLFMKGLPS